MTEIAIGDLVQLLVDVLAQDVHGEKLTIAKGINVSVVEIYKSTGKLEIESVINDCLVTATVKVEDVDLVWSEQLARHLDDMVM